MLRMCLAGSLHTSAAVLEGHETHTPTTHTADACHSTCHIGVVLFVAPIHVQPKRRHSGSWCSKMPSRRPAHRCAAFQNG